MSMDTEPHRRPVISLIVAMGENRVIGIHNRLPWKIPADLQYFKRLTMGRPIVMGRKTYESIGRPLPGRTNIVVSRDASFDAAGCVVVRSVEQALAAAAASDEVMIIGGASLYEQLLPRAGRLYLTLVHHEFDGDAWFPRFDPAQWRERERSDHPADGKNPYGYSFISYERRRLPASLA